MITNDPDRIHWPDLVEEGLAARRQLEGAQWRLGDLASEVETTYGKLNLQAYAREIGVEYGTLLNYRHVSKRIESSRRRENLSWSHHERLAASKIPPREGDEWLLRCETEGWTVRKLTAMVEAGAIRKKWEAERCHEGPSAEKPPASLRGAGSPASVWAHDLAEAALFSQALRDLASIKLTPPEVASIIPVEQAAEVDASITDAYQWLTEFIDTWRARWAGRPKISFTLRP